MKKLHRAITVFEHDLSDESKTTLAEALRTESVSMIYQFDFGDNGQHEVILEKILSGDTGMKYPTCLGGERRCPPEDVGGYEEFLEAIFDPAHEEYEHHVGWASGHFVDEFDTKAVNRKLSRRPGR